MSKTIAIISPDTVPLKLKETAPKYIREGAVDYPIKDKCCKITSTGKRAWVMAQALSKDTSKYTVDLFVPDLNFPGLENIDHTGVSFGIKKYNFKNTMYDWSEELDRKLKGYDFVIVQATVGAAWKNCAVLPRSTNVIVDAWAPMPVELPCALLNYPKIKREHSWQKFEMHYKDLLMRANCVLYANDRQRYFYEGYLFSMGKLSWKAFKFSPLLKVPYGIDIHSELKRTTNTTNLKLLWYGALYPWYDFESIFKIAQNNQNVELDFVGVRHPRYTRLYDQFYKDYFKDIDKYPNIRILPDYVENKAELFSQYDAAIALSQNWLEETYAHRVRVLEMVSYGLPVLVNAENVLYDSYDYEVIRNILLPTTKEQLPETITELLQYKKRSGTMNVHNSLVALQKDMSWDTTLAPLVGYIDQFSKEICVDAE